MFQPRVTPVKQDLSSLPEIGIKVTGLPSKSLSYPKDASVKYRTYSFGEIKKLSSSKLSEKENFLILLDGIDCSFDKMQLTVPDFLYLSLLRNISSVKGSHLRITFNCNSCGKKSVSETELTEVEFGDLEFPELPINLELKDKTLSFSPITVGQYFELLDLGKGTEDIAILAKQVINMKFEDAYKLISELDDLDEHASLNEIDRLLDHGVKPVKVKCKSCNKESFVEIVGGQSLVVPFRKSKGSNGPRIYYGKTHEH